MQNWQLLKVLFVALPLAACSSPDTGSQAGAEAESAPPAAAPADTGPAGEVFIVAPADNAEVQSPVTVSFGIEGFGVAPAGTYAPRTGHHHLLIDVPLPPLDQPVPADANHIHFGKGQTETTVELPPGQHTLQLLLGDGNHMPHTPPVYSSMVTITVVE